MIAFSLSVSTGHVGLNVTDLERSIAFYTEVLGLEVAGGSRRDGQRYAFLGQGGGVILTLWEQSKERFSPATPGLHHLAFRVANPDQVEEVLRRLRTRNAPVHHGGIVAHQEGSKSGGVFFEDPDGIRLEVFAPGGMESRAAQHKEAPACGFF